MNEENINNVMTYIQQNPDQPTEDLVRNLMHVGYPLDDIKIGLGRLGLSPLAIPGYSPPIQQNPEGIGITPSRTIFAIAGATVILLFVFYMGNTNIAKILSNIPFLGRPPQLTRPSTHEKAPAQPSITPPITPTANSPTDRFQQLFKNNTYKITITQKATDNESAFLIYYTENGDIDRQDNYVGMSYIVRTNSFYTLNNTAKTFSKVDSTDFRYGVLVQSLQDSFLLNNLLINQDPQIASWVRLNDNQWKRTDKTAQQYEVVDFDEDGLPTSLSYHEKKDNTEKSSYKINFEPVTISNELLTIPKGYKEVQQIDP